MRRISFTPSGFDPGEIYDAKLILNGNVQATLLNLTENVPAFFDVTVPESYIISVVKRSDGACVENRQILAYFPIVESSFTGVNCNDNTYTVTITLQNPTTAGDNVQYGWSLLNDCSTVSNWNGVSQFIIQADDTVRYFFVRNNSQGCCNFVTQNAQSPCVTCTLTITSISFNCNA